MPKLLKGVENRIFKATISLIKQHGYDTISMKMIALESDIAVGTLYNYYPDKQSLIASVLLGSWSLSFEQFDSLLSSDKNNLEKATSFSRLFYHVLFSKKNVGKELLYPILLKEDDSTHLLHRIQEYFKAFLIPVIKEKSLSKSEVEINQISHTLIATSVHLADYFPEKQDENKQYLTTLTRLLLLTDTSQ